MNTPIRILLADDHPLVRSGIRTMLSAEEDMILVAEATTGDEAQRLAVELEPQVLLLDLNMPGPPAIETLSYLRVQRPDVKVLVLTAYNDDAYVRGLVTSGVAGYVLKDEAAEAVVRAIRAVVQGDSWFSRSIMEKLAHRVVDGPELSDEPILTNRERETLNLMARGWDNARIATELNLAEQTIRNYVSRIYLALSLSSRAEAVIWARERGLGNE
jgi:DNA-binding NarL/FixJ family response regulator